jgi:hypothetical protein
MWTKYISFIFLAVIFMNSHPAVAQNEFDYNNWPGRDGIVKTNIDLPVAPFLGYEFILNRIYPMDSSSIWLRLPLKKSPDSPANLPGEQGQLKFSVCPTIIEAQYAMFCVVSDYMGHTQPKRLTEPPVGDVAIIVETKGYYNLFFTRTNVFVCMQFISVSDTTRLFRNLAKEIDKVILNSLAWNTRDPAPHLIISKEFQTAFSLPPR